MEKRKWREKKERRERKKKKKKKEKKSEFFCRFPEKSFFFFLFKYDNFCIGEGLFLTNKMYFTQPTLPEQSWRAVGWILGRHFRGHGGIIFIILTLSHVLSTLFRLSLGNFIGIFFFWLDISAAWLFSSSTCVFRLFFLYNFFPLISVCKICKLYNLCFFHTNRIID